MLQDDSDPVWLQLLKRCAEDPECQLTILCSLAQLLAEQRAEQQQQIADLRQQLSAQQQETAKQTAGLQEQVAGLQGQLQRLHVAVQQVLASHQH